MTAAADGYTPDGGQMISKEKSTGERGRLRLVPTDT